jgi:hypothetical protein
MRARYLALSLTLYACGKEPPPDPVPASLFPLAKGNQWSFKVTESNGTVNHKTQTVTATIATDFGPGFVLDTGRNNDLIRSIQVVSEGQLLRVSEISSEIGAVKERLRFEPPSLRVDLEKTGATDTYEAMHEEVLLGPRGEIFQRSPKTNRFFIDAIDEPVTVPAGDFRAVKVRRETVGSTQKVFWYVFGVGKVKETGGQTEELEAYELNEDGS